MLDDVTTVTRRKSRQFHFSSHAKINHIEFEDNGLGSFVVSMIILKSASECSRTHKFSREISQIFCREGTNPLPHLPHFELIREALHQPAPPNLKFRIRLCVCKVIYDTLISLWVHSNMLHQHSPEKNNFQLLSWFLATSRFFKIL